MPDTPTIPKLESPPAPAGAPRDPRLDDLAEIITAYNDVTEKLQQSHATLQDEVLRLRRELTSANVQLQRQQRLSALGEMAAGIAHEIRNPLAAIKLYAELTIGDLFRAEPDVEAGLENARKIAGVVDSMGGIVNDVLTFAREMRPHTQQRLAGELFQKAVEACRPVLEEHGVQVRMAGQQHRVHVDVDLMQQALVNLIRNAAEAIGVVNELPSAACGLAGQSDHANHSSMRTTDENERKRLITLEATPDDAGLTVTVTDTGPGLNKDAEARIFNPFFTTRSTGTGLGLAIVHRIADAHAGSITTHNHPDHGGAVFTLYLPDPNHADAERSEASGIASGPTS